MDRITRLAGRNAAPPAAGPAARSNEKDGKRSMLDSFKRRSYISDFIIGSQVKVLSRFKGLKTAANTVNVVKNGIKVKRRLESPPLAPPGSLPTQQPDHPQSARPESSQLVCFDNETLEPMPSSLGLSSQKRKQPEEHDDAPSRTKSKSRPLGDDPEKHHVVQAWVNEQEEAVTRTAMQLVPGGGDVSRRDSPSLPLPISVAKEDDPPNQAPSNRSSATESGLNSELLAAIRRHGSNLIIHSQPHAVTPSSELLMSDERRGSTATTTNLTYRDSTFSTCPSVATGLTSPSEISLVLTTGRRLRGESRSSSFFSKASPRSSIASSSPSPQFFMSRTLSSNSNGLFEDAQELVKHPLPNVPRIDPLRSHPTFMGMDLGNLQNAVTFDQVVKMGHVAQERRVSPKPYVDATMLPYDKAPLLGGASASAPKDLAPITETASDDGSSSARKMQLHGSESTRTENCNTSDSNDMGTSDNDIATPSLPGSPESSSRVCDSVAGTMGGHQSSRNLTPATSVTGISDTSMGDALTPQSEESDDSLSDITDYTEDSLFEAVEAFGPALSNPLVLSIILTFKDEVVRLVLARITSMLGDGHGNTQHNNGESSGPSSGVSSSNGSLQNNGPASHGNGTRKRALDGDRHGSREDEDEDEDDDRNKRTKPTLEIPSDLEVRLRKLACPFFKRYPETKWNKACCGPGFPTVHRIKEHVYRKHAPPYCQRCHVTFADEKGLEEHAQSEVPCIVRKGPLSHQGITPEQRTRLKCRKKVNRNANQTEEERWVELYSLLFPEVPRDQIPSPYYDLKSCDQHFTPAAAPAFRQILADLGDRIARQLQEQLRLIPGAQSGFIQAQLPEIIRNCIEEALNSVPPQLLGREGTAPVPETQADTPAGLTSAADSHNTAQIGSQFESMERTQEIYRTHSESFQEVTLPENAHHSVPSQDQLGAIFLDAYFPNPLAENADGLMAGGNRQSFPTAAPFTTIGFPSAMLSGTPAVSPTLPAMTFDGFDFADSGIATFRGTLANMDNSTFLFTQEEKSSPNGNTAGHQSNQYTY